MKWYKLWQRAQGEWRYLGWAWISDAGRKHFDWNCGWPSLPGWDVDTYSGYYLFEGSPPGGFWAKLWAPGSPTYDGPRGWFHLWAPSDKQFIGYFYVGYRTARDLVQPPAFSLNQPCADTEVFTRTGQRVG